MRRPRFDPSEESRNRALSLLRSGLAASVPPAAAAAAAAVGRLGASIGSDKRESRSRRVPQPQLQSFPWPSLVLPAAPRSPHPSFNYFFQPAFCGDLFPSLADSFPFIRPLLPPFPGAIRCPYPLSILSLGFRASSIPRHSKLSAATRSQITARGNVTEFHHLA